MEIKLHGENGITFSLFTELDSQDKIINFLKNVKWSKKPDLDNLTVKEVHLFPSFGRAAGFGEPDTIIISDKIIFYIELETEPVDKLPEHFYKQLRNFIELGEEIRKTVKSKIYGSFSTKTGKKFRGKYRTRKLFSDLTKNKSREDYYIIVTNDKSKDVTSIKKITDDIAYKVGKNISHKIGWIGYSSINHLKTISKTKEVISFNLKQ